MAHISTESVADIRARLKDAFPVRDGWKLSVKRGTNGLSVDVDFMAGPHAFAMYPTGLMAHDYKLDSAGNRCTEVLTHGTVNHYYIADHFAPESAAILKKASDIIHRDHWDESDIQSDYFHCAYYVHVGIGRWDKPYLDTTPPAMAQAA